MFWHLFTYRLKILSRNLLLIFWTMLFPILLGLLFMAAFSNLSSPISLETSPIGIVTNGEDSAEFEAILEEVKSDDTVLFEVQHLEKTEADEQLAADDIVGYYEFTDGNIELFVGRNQIPQSILLDFLNQYLQSQDKVEILMAAGLSYEEIASELSQQTSFITDQEQAHANQSDYFFYTLIGMAIMNGLIWGLGNTNDQQADQSANGIRVSLSPRNKFVVSLANLLASFVLFFTQILIILAVFRYIYGVAFGNHWQWLLVLVALGVLNALSLGTLLGNFSSKITFDQKISIGSTITMILSFLAGMMGSTSLKFWISQNLPLLGRINLVNLISESFFQLFYYQSLTPFYHNLLWLAGFTLLFFLANVYFERRVSYEHL